MYDAIAEAPRSPSDCDVCALAERIFADEEQLADSPESLIETLHDDIQQILAVVGQSNDHHERYRAACFQLWGRERVLRR
ncbi:hypothetical protein [Kutzneria sp. 744]|uniref:hypothetical protein n=1 Tax=Kutzneria sp. (strain 744) TaxID=345341 RepID=UPI0004B0A7C4|nr:hypothetical protein [Kutzneria sp. 744]